MELTRESALALLSVQTPKYETVEVPELGTVYVKRLKGGEKDRFEAQNRENDGDFRARTVAHCAFDQRGCRIFTDDDVCHLTEFDPEYLDPIVNVALRLNNYTDNDKKELQKKSTGQADAS